MWLRIIVLGTIIILDKHLCASHITLPITDLHGAANIMNQIVWNCFPNKTTNLFVDDASVNIFRKRSDDSITSSYLFGNSVTRTYISNESQTPIQCVVVMTTSTEKLTRMIQNLAWRKPNQFYIISDGSHGEHDCQNAAPFLMEAWENDLLNVIFICNNGQRATSLFTFNPYMDKAPIPWQKISTVTASNRHPWTLFQRHSDELTCSNLFFEKTNDLGGYIMKVATKNFPPYSIVKINDNRIISFTGIDGMIHEMLQKKLNATSVVYVEEHAIWGNSTHGVITFIKNNHSDFLIVSRFMYWTLPIVEMIHPTRFTAISTVTRRRGFMKSYERIVHYISLNVTALLFATSILAFISLSYILKDPYSNNFLDFIRVYLNVPVNRMPVTFPGRLLFSSILIVFFIFNTVLQANFDQIRIIPCAKRNIEIIDDINDLGYTVFGTPFVTNLMEQYGVKNTRAINRVIKCLELDANEAFADEKGYLGTHSLADECQMPTQELIPTFVTYLTRRYWPLFHKINKLVLKIRESGLIELWYKRYTSKSEVRKGIAAYQPLTLQELSFSLFFLAGGLLCSSVIFLIEFPVMKIMR